MEFVTMEFVAVLRGAFGWFLSRDAHHPRAHAGRTHAAFARSARRYVYVANFNGTNRPGYVRTVVQTAENVAESRGLADATAAATDATAAAAAAAAPTAALSFATTTSPCI